MTKINTILVFFCCTFLLMQLSYATPVKSDQETKDFFVLTIAKGGTGLINKLMRIIAEKKSVVAPKQSSGENSDDACVDDITRFINSEYFAFRHFIPFNHLYSELHELFPHIVAIIHIRDPRDVCVALTFAHSEYIDNLLGGNTTFNEKLLFVIQNSQYLHTHDWKINAANAVEWIKDPNIIVSRFEEIVGEEGGGSKKKQREAIKKIAEGINVRLNEEKWRAIDENLFGGNPTFRSGQINEWKLYFTEEHKVAFKEIMNDILIELGYENGENW